jgi:hypothetical protein
MKTRLACAALLVMLSLAAPAAPQSCPPEDPTIVCGYYCWNFECWGPAPPTSACSAFGAGCASADPSEYCTCGGGF